MKYAFVSLALLIASVVFAAPSIKTEVKIRNAECEFSATNTVGLDDTVIFSPVVVDDSGMTVNDARPIAWEVSASAAAPFRGNKIGGLISLGQFKQFGVSSWDGEIGRVFTIVMGDNKLGMIAPPVKLHVERETTRFCK